MLYPVQSFPTTRLRRNRSFNWKRRLVNETVVTTNDLIWPLFIREASVNPDIPSMPGARRYSLDEVLQAAEQALENRIPAIMFFPAIDESKKTLKAEEAYNPKNIVNTAIRKVKQAFPELGVITDVALDPYTSHGHDGLLKDDKIVNDETLTILSKQALSLADAGVDMISPSDMMDGRIGRIRQDLDKKGYQDVGILAYSAKYVSAFYGPFRDAVQSKSYLGKMDKKTYQMSNANSDEAIREVALDIQEGADMVMIKPGLPYLDIVRRVKDTFQVPTAVYQISGEYAMLKAAANNGWLDYENCLLETLIAFRRAGADVIISYAAPDAAQLINERYGYFDAA